MSDESIYDDHDLLADALVRTLHRADDGHLGPSPTRHKSLVSKDHNVAVLYYYECRDGLYDFKEHYVYSRVPRVYTSWRTLVNKEVDRLNRIGPPNFHGVYGWVTAQLRITPMREGDLFLKVDKHEVRGVRLSFSARENGNDAQT